MGKLQTAVTLPKRILLQGWAGDQDGEDINGEYVYGKFTPLQIGQEQSGYIRQGGYLAYIFFNKASNLWVHYSSDTGWYNNSSTNPNVLPYTGWNTADGQGPAGSITILENISAKNNKISIKKQNTGSGTITIDAYKINDYIFSYNSAIDFNTSCSDENGDYYPTQADPYQISFNVNLPKKPKQVQVKLKGINGDDMRYMGIVLTNPQNKPCFINQYNFDRDRRATRISAVTNALVTDNAQDGLFQTGIGELLSNDITGRPYVTTGILGAKTLCSADYFFTGYILVDDSFCQSQMGIFPPPSPPTPNVVSGFLPSVDGLAGDGSNRKYYYTKLNKLIDNNYNGTWKISSWNYWGSDPSDVQNGINNGIDLIFKF